VDDSTPNSERSASFPSIQPLPMAGNRSSMQIPVSLSTRRGSRTSSQATSPSLHPTGTQPTSAIDPAHGSYSSEWSGLGGESGSARRSSRDESAFYQAEATMLSRENQMLRMRIRELERQLSDLSTQASGVTDHETVDGSATVSTQTDLAGEEAEKT
jgi:hypothetical protein